MFKIVKIFELEEIESLSYKGPILAIIAYKNLALRVFNDLDIYVNVGDIPKIQRVLAENGYCNTLKLKTNQNKAYIKFQREYNFRKEISIEIKWKLISPLFSINDNKFLFNSCCVKNVNCGQREIKTLSNENHLIILSIHNVTHYWSTISLLCDFKELVQVNSMDWQQILEKTEKMGTKRILLINMFLINQLFGYDLPEIILTHIMQDKSVINLSNRIIINLFSKKENLL